MKLKFTLILVFFLVVFTAFVFAQGTPPPMPFAPTQAPVDGGLSLLAAAGGVYAVKKLRDKNMRKLY